MQVAIKDMNGPSMSSLPAIYVGEASGLHKMAAPKGRIGVFPQIAASSRGNIWLLAPALSRHKAGYLDYWNGHTWSSRAIPDRLTIYSWGFSYDYHSGVWLSPYAHWTGRRWVATNPAGPTSQYELNYVAAIPGSASTWAIAFSGAHVGKRTYLGMIALNGKRP
jgi:hypothetical protein